MNRSNFDTTLTRLLLACVAAVLVLIPFHAILTVWLSQLLGHYTALRLWKEALLGLSVLLCVCILVRDTVLRRQLLGSKLVWLIRIYAALLFVTGVFSYVGHEVTPKALAYGLLVDLRFLAFFIVVWIAASRSGWLRRWWQYLLLGPAAAVVLFGLLQRFVLPYDFLRHLGYNTDRTIPPYETIDHKIAYLRIQSTLRGANPLGAYLITVIAALLTLLLKVKDKRWWWAGGLVLALLTLILSYSRSAWIGALLSSIAIVLLRYRSRNAQRLLLIGIVGFILALAGSLVVLRNNDHFQNAFFHTDEHSTSHVSSNSGHLSALKDGLQDIKQQPLGDGPGTAGPASIYNDKPARIAENYFIQIGQEAGVLAIGLFVAINVMVALKLWHQGADVLSLLLLAGLVGITFGNLLWHAWTDDTLAYVWWGFAGLAIAAPEERKHAAT